MWDHVFGRLEICLLRGLQGCDSDMSGVPGLPYNAEPLESVKHLAQSLITPSLKVTPNLFGPI